MIQLSDIRVGDTVETYIEGGWRVINGKRVEKERDRGRVTGVFPHKRLDEYDLAVILEGSSDYGLLRLSEVTKVIPARALAPKRRSSPARWRSGYAEDCKSALAGEFPR